MVSLVICSPELVPNAPFLASSKVPRAQELGSRVVSFRWNSRQLGHGCITAEQPGYALGKKIIAETKVYVKALFPL